MPSGTKVNGYYNSPQVYSLLNVEMTQNTAYNHFSHASSTSNEHGEQRNSSTHTDILYAVPIWNMASPNTIHA